MPPRLNEFRLPTDCWALLYRFLGEVHAVDQDVLPRLRAAVPKDRVASLGGHELLTATRTFIRQGANDETLQAVWDWAEGHCLVRPLGWLRGKAPWACVESYPLSNYCRSLVCTAAELVRLWPGDQQAFPALDLLASSPLRHDPSEVEEYLALAAAARHLSPADRNLIAAVLRGPAPRPLNVEEADALVLAGAVPLGDQHSFAALARFQVGLQSAENIGKTLFRRPAEGELGLEAGRGEERSSAEEAGAERVSRQLVDHWIRGAAQLLVGRIHATAWLRDPIPAGRLRKDATARGGHRPGEPG